MRTTRVERRQRVQAFVTSGVTAGLGIAINLATDWKTSLLAWSAVLALTVGSGFVALIATEPARGPGDDARSASVSAHGTGNVAVHTLRQVVHHNPPAVGLVLVVAAVVVMAGVGGLLAHRLVGPATGGAVPEGSPPSPPPSSPLPFTHAVRKLTPTCGWPWITPKAPEQISLPVPEEIKSSGGWSDWDEVNEGGAAASPGQVVITVQGRTDAEVVLMNLEVRVVARREPIRGTALSRQCGGEGAVRWLSVDLDRDPVVATADRLDEVYPFTPDWERKPIKFPYTVSLTDAETFVIKASTEGCD
ncbi:hypothetical protein LZG04_35965 [Saccharothrix sp. S26]|uniref:hypothetical protein n=1 Tax=Saccharothrix sp. S26 TaxID=2907215 RepID=UPI001F45118D|nr:hypothetical protein [Saccharothrix sp. S26]MCE7000172.1 hypothetical protein [Saccharothrix sp. S26]